jgi:hypothetical protein
LAVVDPTPATVAVALTDPPAFAEVEPVPATEADVAPPLERPTPVSGPV